MQSRRGGHGRAEPHRGSDDVAPDPGAVAASARVDALLDRLGRIDLQVVVVAPPDDARIAAQQRARDAATHAGRGELFEAARAAARDVTMRGFARAGFSGTWAVTDMAVSVTRAADRVAAAIAFEEAAMAAVVEDIVDEETLEVLRSTSDDLVRLTGMPAPGSLASIAAPAGTAGGSALGLSVVAVALLAIGLFALAVGGQGAILALALAIAMLTGLWRRRRRTDP
jgi:hypothetical protein